jgi:hypothetical protein
VGGAVLKGAKGTARQVMKGAKALARGMARVAKGALRVARRGAELCAPERQGAPRAYRENVMKGVFTYSKDAEAAFMKFVELAKKGS